MYSGQVLTSFTWEYVTQMHPLTATQKSGLLRGCLCFPGSRLKRTFDGMVQFPSYHLQHSMGFEATWRDSVRPLGCGM